MLSKYVWVRPMKNKTASCLLEAFGSILSKGRKPDKLRIYKGTEFLNQSFQQYHNNKSNELYAENNELKASVVEKWIKLLNLNFIVISRQSVLFITSMFCKS